jgi:hypothetical protein
MEYSPEVYNVLNRLISIHWAANVAHYRSHRLLVFEYFRRSALWATMLNATDSWPIVNLALHLEPTLQLHPAVLRSFHDHLQKHGSPPREMVALLEAALYWARLQDLNDERINQLPAPYEPILLLYERGGYFFRSHDGIEITVVMTVSHRGWQQFLTQTPYIQLDPSVLDQVDSDIG